MTKYVFAVLFAFLVAAGVMLKLSWSANDRLKADAIELQNKLDTTEADLKVSVDNANRMLSEKNRLIVMQRQQAEVNQREAVASANIQKDIEYADDGDSCVKSDPVQRLLRGLHDGRAGTPETDAAIPDARRP
jgi:hypothetical protein